MKESVLLRYLRPRAGLGAETPSGLFPTLAQLPALIPGVCGALSFRSTRTQSGRRLSSASLLFSTRQGSAPAVLPPAMPASWPQSRPPEGGRQGSGPQPVPASFPPSYSGMRGSQGLRISARTLRRLRRCSQQLLQGALSVSPREAGILKVCAHFPRCWKNVLG